MIIDQFTKERVERGLTQFVNRSESKISDVSVSCRRIKLQDLEDGRFFLFEEYPIPDIETAHSECMEAFLSDPNGYQSHIDRFPPETLSGAHRVVLGEGPALYFADIKNALECVFEALERNCVLTDEALVEKYAQKQPKWLRERMRNTLSPASVSASIEFLEQCKLDETALPPALFDDKVDLFGDPISGMVRMNVLSYINNPTPSKWLEIRSLPITPMATLWHMLRLLKPDHPLCKLDACMTADEIHPDILLSGDEIKALLKRGVELNNRHIDMKIADIKQRIGKTLS